MGWKLPEDWWETRARPASVVGRWSGLSRRLAAVAALVPEGASVVDVGTDHAILPIALVDAGHCPRVIAADLRPRPLAVAARNLVHARHSERVTLRQSDGLAALERDEVSVMTCCGMGGGTICGILEARPPETLGIRRLILQANKGVARLRRHLSTHGWRLDDERFLAEGQHFYLVMVAEYDPERAALSDEEVWLGPHARRRGGELYECWVRRQLRWLGARPDGGGVQADTLRAALKAPPAP